MQCKRPASEPEAPLKRTAKLLLTVLTAASITLCGVPTSAIETLGDISALDGIGALGTQYAEAATAGISSDGTITIKNTTKTVSASKPVLFVGGTGSVTYAGSTDTTSDGRSLTFETSDSSVVSVNSSAATYTVKSEGTATISAVLTVTSTQSGTAGSSIATETVLGSVTFLTGKSVKSAGAKLSKKTWRAYHAGDYDDEGTVDITFSGMPEMSNVALSCTLSGSALSITSSTWRKAKKTARLVVAGSGSATLSLTVNDKTFTARIVAKTLRLNGGTCIVAVGGKKTLRLTGYKNDCGSVTWTSRRKTVAGVSKSGVVSGRKVGTGIVYARVGGKRVGCAVSVVTQKRYRVIQRAKSIAKGTYSQARRMSSGYYDCSSLVWRAYRLEGVSFGVSSGWAPVAATIGKWCVARGGRIKGGASKSNVNSLKIRAGDLFFRCGSSNGRYKGIYHVEMVAGLVWLSDKKNGKANLTVRWVNREDGYGVGESSTMMARP